MHMKANTLYNGKLTVINQELKRIDAISLQLFLWHQPPTAPPPPLQGKTILNSPLEMKRHTGC